MAVDVYRVSPLASLSAVVSSGDSSCGNNAIHSNITGITKSMCINYLE